jgi:hypothetical protein
MRSLILARVGLINTAEVMQVCMALCRAVSFKIMLPWCIRLQVCPSLLWCSKLLDFLHQQVLDDTTEGTYNAIFCSIPHYNVSGSFLGGGVLRAFDVGPLSVCSECPLDLPRPLGPLYLFEHANLLHTESVVEHLRDRMRVDASLGAV